MHRHGNFGLVWLVPIVFPRGIVERVVEKVVEKIVYIAVSLSREFRIAFSIVTNPSKPIPQQIASTIFALTKFIYAFFLMLEKLKFYIVSNPTKPPRTTAGTIITSLLQSGEKAPKLAVSYHRISNPSIPTPQNLISLLLSVDVRKSP